MNTPWAAYQWSLGSLPGGDKTFFSPKPFIPFCGPTGLLVKGHTRIFSEERSGRNVKLTIHIYLVQKTIYAWSVSSRSISKENGTDLKRWIEITCKLSRNKLCVQVEGRRMDWHILDFVLYWDKRIKAIVSFIDIFQVTVSWIVRLCSLKDGYRYIQEDPLSCFNFVLPCIIV